MTEMGKSSELPIKLDEEEIKDYSPPPTLLSDRLNIPLRLLRSRPVRQWIENVTDSVHICSFG